MKSIRKGFSSIDKGMLEDLEDNNVKVANYEFADHILKKEASAITTALPAIVGSLVGMKTTQHLNSKDKERADLGSRMIQNKQMDRNNTAGAFNKDYYSQIANIDKNLQPTFSPFGVLYVMNYKGRNITLDNINTEEMNDEMRKAWASRDSQYYKNIFMNKVVSEAQLVEQMFAKRMVQNLTNMNNRFGAKQASYDETNTIDLIDGMCRIKDIYENNNESKVIEILASSLNDIPDGIEIKCEVNRPVEKYAGVMSSALSFLGMNSPVRQLKAVAKDMANPHELMKAKVEFLPDRVLFIKDNLVITQLPVMHMNEEGYEHFRNKDEKYFKGVFEKSMTKNISQLQEIRSNMNKDASELLGKEEIFYMSELDPRVYYMSLNKELGTGWLKYDPEVLIAEIEDNFHLRKAMCDVAFNKVLMIQLINESSEPYRNALIFEKCIRAFTNKSVDFDEWQANIEPKELMYAIMRMNDLTTLDDISDNFSDEVIDYIVTILYNGGIRNLTDIVGDTKNSLSDEFYEIINANLLGEWNVYSADSNEKKAVEDNIKIATISNKLYNSVNNIAQVGGKKIDEAVDKLADASKLTVFVANAIKQSIKLNLIIDGYCNMKNLEAEEQLKNLK